MNKKTIFATYLSLMSTLVLWGGQYFLSVQSCLGQAFQQTSEEPTTEGLWPRILYECSASGGQSFGAFVEQLLIVVVLPFIGLYIGAYILIHLVSKLRENSH
jgi:membrane-anchored protein YejM (alkaline phosphatase superfamily)